MTHDEYTKLSALKLLNSSLALFWSRRNEYAARDVIKGAIRNYRRVNAKKRQLKFAPMLWLETSQKTT